MPNIHLLGIHIYDGHLHGTMEERLDKASVAFSVIRDKLYFLKQELNVDLKIVAGGSGTFPFMQSRKMWSVALVLLYSGI